MIQLYKITLNQLVLTNMSIVNSYYLLALSYSRENLMSMLELTIHFSIFIKL